MDCSLRWTRRELNPRLHRCSSERFTGFWGVLVRHLPPVDRNAANAVPKLAATFLVSQRASLTERLAVLGRESNLPVCTSEVHFNDVVVSVFASEVLGWPTRHPPPAVVSSLDESKPVRAQLKEQPDCSPVFNSPLRFSCASPHHDNQTAWALRSGDPALLLKTKEQSARMGKKNPAQVGLRGEQ